MRCFAIDAEMDVIKPLLSGKLLMSATAAEVLQSALGRPLDLLYSRIGGFNGRFFPAGWGNLGIVNLQEDIERIKDWPPEDIKVQYRGSCCRSTTAELPCW